jgi:hypothetical protein
MKTLHKNLLIGGAGLILAGALLLYPAYRWSKSFRAGLLAERASQAYEVGNFQTAFDHAFSASLMAPDDLEIAILRARAALKLERRNPFALWEPILHEPAVTAAHLVELAERLDALGQPQQVNQVLPVLLARDPANERGRELYLQSLYRDFRFTTVERLAGRWIEEGTASWPIHSAFVEALFNYPTEEKRAQGLAHLHRLSERPDTLGLYALRRLLSLPHLDPEETRTCVGRLEAHPEAAPEDKVLVLGWRYFREGSIGFNEAHRGVLQLIDIEEPQDRKRYLTWLSNMQRFDLVLEKLELETAVRDGELYRLLLNAMIEAGRASEVVTLTIETTAELPLTETAVLVLRARALGALGQQEELNKALDLAVRLSTLDDFQELERELARLNRWRNLGELYWRLMENRMTQSFAAGKLIFSTYYLNDETGLIKALESIKVEQFAGDPNLQCFVSYLKLLYAPNERLEAAHALEDLIAQHPNLFDFRIVLSLAHLLAGRVEMVERLQPAIPPELPAEQLRYLRVAHHIVRHFAESPDDRRAAMAGKIPFDDLLPRERALLLGQR